MPDTMIELECDFCGTPFERRLAKVNWLKRQGMKATYCSRACSHAAIRLGPERVFERCIKTQSGCWEWAGCLLPGGYGLMSVMGKPVQTHRAAWQVAVGPIPKGLFVLHRCDNRRCVNPDHLFLGTNADNMLDMARKGRSTTKLSEADIRAIVASDEPIGHLAKRYGLTRAAIRGHKRRRIFADA